MEINFSNVLLMFSLNGSNKSSIPVHLMPAGFESNTMFVYIFCSDDVMQFVPALI